MRPDPLGRSTREKAGGRPKEGPRGPGAAKAPRAIRRKGSPGPFDSPGIVSRASSDSIDGRPVGRHRSHLRVAATGHLRAGRILERLTPDSSTSIANRPRVSEPSQFGRGRSGYDGHHPPHHPKPGRRGWGRRRPDGAGRLMDAGTRRTGGRAEDAPAGRGRPRDAGAVPRADDAGRVAAVVRPHAQAAIGGVGAEWVLPLGRDGV